MIAIIMVFFILLCGCIEEEKNNTDDNNGNNEDTIPDYEKNILGTWSENETFENFTYIIEYKFFSNNSFFSGLMDEGVDFYNVTIWGSYNITSEVIQLTVDGETSDNKYLISEDGDFLLLYYEDGINYDVFRKVV